jgi:sec-independent protein translocase protein TatB
MLELSFGKMMIIAVVALIVLGPEKLPKVARTLGHLLGRARSYANQVKQDIDREMQMDELRKLQEQAKEAARSFESAVNEAGRSVEAEASSASKVFNEMETDYKAKLETTATTAVENSIAPPHALTAQDEVAALETSIAEQAVTQTAAIKPMISAEQMSASLPRSHAASLPQPHATNLPEPANSVDATKNVA